MFKKNTAVTGFAFGLVSATDGSAITTGTVTGYYTLDGLTQGTIAGASTHEGFGQWTVNLLAAEMNGDIVGLIFTHASAINASFTIKTTTVLNTDLDTSLATVDSNVDLILEDTGTTLPATIATAQADLDIITGSDGATVSSASEASAVTAVWSDTLITYTNGEAGKRVKGITTVPSIDGTVNDVSATTTSFISTLTGYGDTFFDDALIIVEIATDQWQSRPVATYTSTTGAFTVNKAFISAPGNGVAVSVVVTHIHTVSEIAKSVWDTVLTGATHNVSTSAGRRLRQFQDTGAYESGSVWIDTLNGTAGTSLYENGTPGLPVNTLADALTLATSANLKHLHLVNGSSITFTSALDNYEFSGDEWGLAFGGQSADGASINNAHLSGVGVSGTFSGNPHILHSTIGAITGPDARIGWCALTGAITSNGTGIWVIHSCWGLSGAQFDFGGGAAQTVYITDWVGGPITISNMSAGDVLYFEGRSAALTLAATCTAGTVYLAGDIALTNSGSGQTINQTSRYELTRIISDSTAFSGADIALIKTDTTEILADIAAVDAIVDDLKLGIILGAAVTGTLSTTTITTDLTGYTVNQIVGRSITFTSGPADGESTIITAYAVTNGQISFTGDFALTVAPADTDTFKIT